MKDFINQQTSFIKQAFLNYTVPCFYIDGGIGDELICSTVFRELKKRHIDVVAFRSRFPLLFEGNSDIDYLLNQSAISSGYFFSRLLASKLLHYAHYDSASDRDLHLPEHILALLCRASGVKGQIDLRPYMYLDMYEIESGIIFDNQVVIQSSCLAAEHPMYNKEWDFNRMQEVCTSLKNDFRIIQLGSISDPPLSGSLDLRGKSTLRQSAAILANSLCFIGPVGFLMHLARSVDCRGVILYGGRENPDLTGYISNINLYSDLACSPCWQRNRCDYGRLCMEKIQSDEVIKAVYKQISLNGHSIEVASVIL